MAINFLFGNRTPAGFKLSGVVEFDADLTVEETHERAADVTEHPVESGARVSDHVILQPARLTLEGFVTDAGVAVFGAAAGRTQTAFETLTEAWREREPVQVVTGYRTYQDMVIVRLDMPRERPGSMRFSMELKHVTIVESEVVNVAAPDADTADLAAGETDAGRQPTRGASDATESRSSLLFDTLGL